jgi:hypothetical protein
MPKKFTLTKPVTQKQSTRAVRRNEQAANDFVHGKEPTRAKTFNLPIRLAHKLRIVAARRGQTDTEIIVGLIERFLRDEPG